jgi:hypothetical protein
MAAEVRPAALAGLAAAFAFGGAASARADAKLETMRQESLHGPPAPRDDHGSSSSSSTPDDDPGWLQPVFDLMALPAKFAWHSRIRFLAYPYADPEWHYAVVDYTGGIEGVEPVPPREDAPVPRASLSSVSARVAASAGRDGPTLRWLRGEAIVTTSSNLGLDATTQRFYATDEAQDRWLEIDTAAVTFDWITLPAFHAVIGVGAVAVRDAEHGTPTERTTGWHVPLRYDLYPGGRLRFGLRLALGELETVEVREVGVDAGVFLWRVEARVGWEQRSVGSVTTRGPEIGAAIWW